MAGYAGCQRRGRAFNTPHLALRQLTESLRSGLLQFELPSDTRGTLSLCRFPRTPTFTEPQKISTASSPAIVWAPTLASLPPLWLTHRVLPETGFPPTPCLAHPEVS